MNGVNEVKEFALEIANLIDDRKGEDIVLLDLTESSSLSDYFVIASANSDRQVGAIAEHIEDELSKKGIEVKRKDGYRSKRWIVLDYLDVMVHIFYHEERKHYDLESVLNDAKVIPFA